MASFSESALALDLGSTRIKLASWSTQAGLQVLESLPAPASQQQGLSCTSDPGAWLAAASLLVSRHARAGWPLGIASQRSSFVLWERASGKALTPLISWQDRSAADWCLRHRERESAIWRASGLPLSPHYAGPKLAHLLEADPRLAARARQGEVLFGTLDVYLAWNWSRKARFCIDGTQAARTLLADPARGEWSAAWLDWFNIPRGVLPAIVTSQNQRWELDSGLILTASVADQPAAVLAALAARTDRALMNFGTGGFVLRPTGSVRRPLERYLCGPILAGPTGLWALEGTINGGGGTLDEILGPIPDQSAPDRHASQATSRDPLAECFARPDASGLGAPYWRAELGLLFSKPALSCSSAERARVFLEGLAFRACAIARDLEHSTALTAYLVSGGLAHHAHHAHLVRCLSACLARPVCVLEDSESTLQGAALLAAGVDPTSDAWPSSSLGRLVEPDPNDAWIAAKFQRWQAWLAAGL